MKREGKRKMAATTVYRPVRFDRVTIDDRFWAPKIELNRAVTIPTAYDKCKETGRIDAFRQDWKPGQEPVPHVFWDSDVAKWIEAASFSLATTPDPALDAQLDELIVLIASAQQEDGYLNTHYTAVEPENRWTNLRDNHELYCAGHLIEAAVAHYEATGKRGLLQVACRYADYIGTVFGTGPGQKRGYCGHEEIELALVKLYRTTGEPRYLQLGSYFVEERGREPHYFDLEAAQRGEEPGRLTHHVREYSQSHKPVREQDRVVGHSVRAMYLYAAMADLAAEQDDDSLYAACERLWTHLCTKHMYLTGGIGASAANEGFTNDYELPNETAYCETCASIGLIMWNHRMLQRRTDGKYADVMERVLYNGAISGISMDGKQYFYGNPLASYRTSVPKRGDKTMPDYYRRSDWFGCSCCPPNLSRLLASLGQYAYSTRADELVVHLYMQGEAEFDLDGRRVRVIVETDYPWDGDIRLRLAMDEPTRFALKLRIPGWCEAYELAVNGSPAADGAGPERGYESIDREWSAGDEIRLRLHMPVERVYAHPDVRHNIGHAALQRGPLVYCVEQADHDVPVRSLLLPRETELAPVFEPELLGGVVTLRGSAVCADRGGWEHTLYRTSRPLLTACAITAVPYYSWANREPGEMKVWLPES
ncbi:glycoside hydrolase family 127 protein [Paenibacillus cymbidii]|uniref:glycoside hydrolase family 127 protein n=1 Tax=Paenibacillus cymbidii TaxID=1639034 RepID=UPI001F16DD7A|nr:beta-L-arabinofuranosidase domain-containing protein [Paenibacillus cymbidii]